MKAGIISLGCKKNLVDTEMIIGLLDKSNVEITANPRTADIIIINTCSFIQSAKEEAINTIFEMHNLKKKDAKIIVVGCFAQRYKKELKNELPEVDCFITIDEYPKLGLILEKLLNNEISFEKGLDYFTRIPTTPDYQAYVRIADGCDNCCSYCAIPLIRGKYKSRKKEDILLEINEFVKQGVNEIILISQDTSRYGRDLYGKNSLADLLEEIAIIPNLPIIRMLYLYPDEVDEHLIDVVSKYRSIVPYFDIPIQHASDKVLKSMNRRGSNADLRKLFKMIRNKIPNAILRTTIIVGYPGETEEDFQILKDFIKEIEFDRLGTFMYSAEDDTPAAKFPNQVEGSIKKTRFDEIMLIQSKISYHRNKNHIGQFTLAIVEDLENAPLKYKARGYMSAPDNIDGIIVVESKKELEIGQLVFVKITNAHIYDLFGEVVEL